MLGLSPLDDGRHRHHRFLLLHHLARPARTAFTRHRGPIYLSYRGSPPLVTTNSETIDAQRIHTTTITTTTITTINTPPPRCFSLSSGPHAPSSSRRHFARKSVPFFPPTASSSSRSPFPALPSVPELPFSFGIWIWYVWRCSLHFFGTFVIDRDRLPNNYSTAQKRKRERERR